ncbi:T9SS type A sorting domain-containing protein [Ferruginibacter profundus]
MKKLSLLTVLALLTLLTSAVPKLSSYPSATAVIFLDFDGHYVQSTVWNGGAPITCAPSTMTDPEITEAFNRTAEDYRPFDINITTDSTVFLAAPLNKRIRIIITPTSSWFGGVGGVSYIGSFTWGDDTPGFVFCDRLGPNSPKMVGECCSHESGHTVGLSHQSKYGSDCVSPIETYNIGYGVGEPSWAPIMGNSYYRNMSNWNNGPTPYGCTNIQDNLSIITTQNGFGYRPDDYTEVMNGSTTVLPAGSFVKNGIITTNTDKDAFKFSITQSGSFHLTAVPFSVAANNTGANLDIKLELYNNSGTLINTYDPAGSMSVTVDTVLNTGNYYIKIDGSGNVNIGEYGSLGAYTLSGGSVVLPIKDIALTGNTDNNKHNLAWNIIADEPAKTIEVQVSADAINYKHLTTAGAGTKQFSYVPFENAPEYYRIKVTSVIGQEAYSNAVFLKGIVGKTDNNFKVSTLIQNEITVHASVPYQYQLSDINGSVICKGIGVKGFNSLNISNQPRGMYIIQLFSNNQVQSERIIKQ